LRKGVSFTGFVGTGRVETGGAGLRLFAVFATPLAGFDGAAAFTALTAFTTFDAGFCFGAGVLFAAGLGADLPAFAFGAGFFAAFFGCGFDMGNSVFWNEKGGIDTDFTPEAQGIMGTFFAAFRRRFFVQKNAPHHELALP
jgi:hypothetical protein